jgi:hypothetical protein
MDNSCSEHSGICKAILTLESNTSKQWEELDKGRERMDNIMTRLNFILGGIVVAIVMLLVNIVFKIV